MDSDELLKEAKEYIRNFNKRFGTPKLEFDDDDLDKTIDGIWRDYII